MGLLNRIKQYAGTALLCSAALMSGCEKEKEEREKYKGSADDAIAEVSTPKQAQDFINKFIAYKDRSRDIRGANGGNTYSLSKLLDKDEGLCRDGAVFAAASLKDDGFPSLFLSRTPQGDRGHVVFVYQDQSNPDMNPDTPNWGSVGINDYDFRVPQFTLEQIAQGIDAKFNYPTDGSYSLMDLSLFDLKGGGNGWVNHEICKIFYKRVDNGIVFNGSVSSSQNDVNSVFDAVNYVVVGGQFVPISKSTTSVMYDDKQFVKEQVNSFDNNLDNVIDFETIYSVTGRWPSGSRKSAFMARYNYNSGSVSNYSESLSEYFEGNDPGSIRLLTEKEYGSDFILDSIYQEETLPDGRIIKRWDNDADGNWDFVQGP